jgi:phosphatidylserine/phosphatidylglycerophosphate/cardiolipin synthase-like enzyme
LFETAHRGVGIQGVVEEKFYQENTDIIEEFSENDIQLRPLESSKLHAKALLVDDAYLYIGSINFSRYSFDENREIGVIITDQEIIEKYLELFESDF